MKTIQTIVTEKIGEIQNLSTKYFKWEKVLATLDSKDDTELLNQANDKLMEFLNQFITKVTELAELLGFSIKKQDMPSVIDPWEDIFSRLIVRWATSQSVLHQLNPRDKDLLENSEAPFKD